MPVDLTTETIDVGAFALEVARPRDADELIDEARFDEDEFMPYWAELWKSGLELARVVSRRALAGRRVVELGCGLGLPSLAAARCGAQTLATDWAPEALELLRANALRNNVELETLVVSWYEPDALLRRAPFDLVLAGDVLYEERNVDALLELLPRLGNEVLVAEPGRSTAGRFFTGADGPWTISREGQVSLLRRDG